MLNARAVDLYQRDQRFHILVTAAVAAALHDHGPIDPDAASKAAHDIARQACVVALQRAFDDDAELRATRMERDHYKKLALEFSTISKAPVSVPADAKMLNAAAIADFGAQPLPDFMIYQGTPAKQDDGNG